MCAARSGPGSQCSEGETEALSGSVIWNQAWQTWSHGHRRESRLLTGCLWLLPCVLRQWQSICCKAENTYCPVLGREEAQAPDAGVGWGEKEDLRQPPLEGRGAFQPGSASAALGPSTVA